MRATAFKQCPSGTFPGRTAQEQWHTVSATRPERAILRAVRQPSPGFRRRVPVVRGRGRDVRGRVPEPRGRVPDVRGRVRDLRGGVRDFRERAADRRDRSAAVGGRAAGGWRNRVDGRMLAAVHSDWPRSRSRDNMLGHARAGAWAWCRADMCWYAWCRRDSEGVLNVCRQDRQDRRRC